MHIIGIDIGTTKIAGVLLEVPGNRVLNVISRNSEADIPSENDWEKIQDPELILKKALMIIEELKNSVSGDIACIGISSQMHGFVYVDGTGHSIGPLHTWQDNRAAIPAGASGETVQEIVKARTGKSIFAGYALATHYFNTLNDRQPPVPFQMATIGCYLGMRLCRLKEASIDPSEGASFGLYDQEEREFFLDDIKALWGDSDFLPRRVPFFHRMGTDGDGIPVFQSMGDNQASFYGAMQGRDEKLLLNLGTGGQVSLLADRVPETLKGLEVRPYPEKQLVVGSTLAGGKSFDLLVGFYRDILSFFGKPVSRKEMYATIDKADFRQPPNPLVVEPFFNGTRLNPEIRGAIKNIDLENLNAPNLLYGFAEAMVRELKDLLSANGLDNREMMSRVAGSGNGIRRNPLVCRMIESLFDCELYISELREEAACGAAFYAAKGLGKRGRE